MATQSDGKVIISTELDNSGIKKDAKSMAATLAAEYKKAGMDSSTAFKKAWEDVRKAGLTTSKQVGKSLRNNIGGSAQAVCGQLGGLKTVLWNLGTAITAVFSAAAIANFAKSSVQAANQLSGALTGLKSILQGQGRSFSDAQKFLEEYTADGLIPMTNAITAYKNLASRGYDDSQIRQTLLALKDASAFGRQSSYSMGEAVESATEGLKNENSVLVDNAGVTKNVAKMWDEYAASIGTTANNLTQQQKIQAEVNGILEESKYQAGDAAKVAGTLSGQLAQLSVNFNNLKVAVGNALSPIIQSFLPVINAAVVEVTRFANAIASVIGALFGGSMTSSSQAAQEVADSYNSAAEGASNLAESTKEAGQAAKRYLAGFDEITKIGGSNVGTGGSGGSASSGSTVSVGTTITADGEINDQISPKLQAVIDKIHELIEPLKNIDFGPLRESMSKLGVSFSELGRIIGESLEWAWFNILVPFAQWTIEEAGPAAIDLFSAALSVLNEVIIALQPLGVWLWDTFLQPIAEWTGGIIVSVLEDITTALTGISDWISEHQGLVQGATVTVGAFMAAWKAADLIMWIDAAGGIAGVLKGITTALAANTIAKLANKAEDIAIIALYIGDYIRAFAGMVAKLAANTAAWVANTAAKVASTAAEWAQIAATTAWNGICAIATTVTTAFGAAIAFLTSPIGLVVIAITALIAIVVLLVKNWDTVKEVAANVWKGIQTAWGNVANWFKTKVLDPLSNGFKGMVNGVIGFLNGLIKGIVSGVNAAIGAVNKLSFDVPDWIPGIGGSRFGFNLKTITYPQIPYLAQGAVLPANKPFLAMVGDQKHGTNVEAPLATIQEAVALVMDDYATANLAGQEAIVAVLREILEAVLGIEIGDDVIGQAVARYNRKMAIVRGGA